MKGYMWAFPPEGWARLRSKKKGPPDVPGTKPRKSREVCHCDVEIGAAVRVGVP